MIVISFFRTPTQLDIVVTTGQRVVLSNGTVFRGRLITSSDQLNNSAINSTLCFKASTGGMTFPICVYEAKQDIWVSATFIRGGYWERSIVDRFIRLLRRNPDVEFVDLWANIETFTLPAARITHVVAVEPYLKSMVRLFKSVHLGGVQDNVSLVFNAISNKRTTSKLGFYSGNVGGTYLKVADRTDCGDGLCTQTIVLDDLLPLMRQRRAVMKVDVEAHQPRVFSMSSASKFFELIDVPLIFMEWNLCERRIISSEVRDLISFFTLRQYQVFSDNGNPLGPNCSKWSSNVVFTKQSLEF